MTTPTPTDAATLKLHVFMPPNSCGYRYVQNQDGTEICTCYGGNSEAHAALIVRYVNNFDAMKQALEFYELNKPDNGALAKSTLSLLAR